MKVRQQTFIRGELFSDRQVAHQCSDNWVRFPPFHQTDESPMMILRQATIGECL